MKRRYELRHDTYGRGYRYTKLEHAQRELAHSVPAGEWYIWDRQENHKVDLVMNTIDQSWSEW
jgi:hypothetical protein